MFCTHCGSATTGGAFCAACGRELQPPPVAVGSAADRRSPTELLATVLLGLSALLLVAGSLLPWLNVTTVIGSFSPGALNGDGMVTLIAGVVLAASALGSVAVRLNPAVVLGAVLATLAAVGVALYDGVHLTRLVSEARAEANGFGAVEPGAGIIAVALGAIAGAAAVATAASALARHRFGATRLAGLAPIGALAGVLAVALMAGLAGANGAPMTPGADRAKTVATDKPLEASQPALDPASSQATTVTLTDQGAAIPTAPTFSSAAVNPGAVTNQEPADGGSYGGEPGTPYGASAPSVNAAPVYSTPSLTPTTTATPSSTPMPTPMSSPMSSPMRTPTAAASITISPSSGPNGATLQVTGQGWNPGSRVVVEYLDASGNPTGSQTTAAIADDGTFTAQLVARDSSSLPGRRTVRASGNGFTATAPYDVTA